jgi:hypothetical protein
MQQAIYIGAGHDIIPVLVLRDIKKFIYIDSQPFSEHGIGVYTKEYRCDSASLKTRHIYENDNLFGRPDFIDKFKELMKQNNFKMQYESKYCLTYQNDYQQIIKYHFSCAFPEFLTDEIKYDISECNTIIMCGYFPDKSILSMMKEPKYLIGNCHTVYTYDPNEDEESTSVISPLLQNSNLIENYILLKEIDEYEYYEHKNIIPSIRYNYNIIKCKDLNEMEAIRLTLKN